MSVAAASPLVARAFRAAPAEVAARQRNAAVLAIAADEGGDIEGVRTIPGAVSGMLRFPITDTGPRVERLDLGILRGYPRTLREERELQGCLEPGGPDLSGADELRRTLFTHPTHSLVTRRDLEETDRLAAGSNEGAHAVAQRGSRIAIGEWHFVAAAGEAVVTRSEVTPSATLGPQVVGYRSPIAERSLRVVYLWDADYPWDVRTEKVCATLASAGHDVHVVARNRAWRSTRECLPEGTVHRMQPWRFAGRRLDNLLGFPLFFSPRWRDYSIERSARSGQM